MEGHSGWQGEGAMGGYLFNNSKMQMTEYTESRCTNKGPKGEVSSGFRRVRQRRDGRRIES